MATSTIQVPAVSGQTLSAQIFAEATPDTVAQTVTLTEYTNNKGLYYGSVVDLATGRYLVRAKNASNVTFGSGFVLTHTNEVGIELVGDEASSSGGALTETNNITTSTIVITSE
jgi:hypothetical protein